VFTEVTSSGAGAFSSVTATGGAFSGNLTAPTVATTDDSTNVATTAWCLLGISVAVGSSGGHIKFPTWLGGVMLQWGSNGGSATVTFGPDFVNTPVVVLGPENGTANLVTGSVTTSGFGLNLSGSGQIVHWLAVGS
jgi:hypothetical protein